MSRKIIYLLIGILSIIFLLFFVFDSANTIVHTNGTCKFKGNTNQETFFSNKPMDSIENFKIEKEYATDIGVAYIR